VAPWEGSVHRITVVPTIANPGRYSLNPLYVNAASGRWATAAGTIYTSERAEVCWAEVARNHWQDVEAADPTGGVGLDREGLRALGPAALEAPFPALRLLRLDIRLERLADLTSAAGMLALVRAGFMPASLTADDYGDCPAIAAVGEGLGWQGVRAPSAAWRFGGTCIALFAEGAAAVHNSEVLAQSARPAIYVIGATEYRAGQRPRWLPAP
jgi:hypothetical protein